MVEMLEKRVAAQRVAAMRHKGAYADIGDVYRRLFAWARRRGAKPAGPALTTFHAPAGQFDPASAEFEVCLPVGGEVKGDAEATVQMLPAATVAYVVHEGPYSRIPARYAELLAWIDSTGQQITGPPREVYVRPPDPKTGDQSQCVTEIQFPVAMA